MNLEWIWIEGNVPSLKNSKEIVSLHTKRKPNDYKVKYAIELPGRKSLQLDLICDRDDETAAPVIRKLRPILIPSKAHKKYEKAHGLDYRDAASKFRLMAKRHSKPLKVGFYFIRDSKRIFDYGNAIATVEDLMTSRGWIPDDNCQEIMSIPLGYHVDKYKPGVGIFVLHDHMTLKDVMYAARFCLVNQEKQLDIFDQA